jgi:parallel beta-helix repeat protein
VESCLIDGAGEEGIYLLGSDCLVRGNVSRENGESGIKVSVSSGSVVSGNIFKANGQHGILAAGASPSGATATIVEANQVTENAFDGIRVADGAGEIKIRGNRVVGNGQDADNTRDNIHILGTTNVECEVVGNTCRKGSGAIRARYGLNVEASASSTLVGPNDLRGGGQTADYLNNGTGTVGPTFEAGATVERGLVVNDIGSNVDARFEGDTDQNLLLVKGSTDRIGVGLSDPNFKVEIKQAGASPGIGIREVSGANFRAGFGLGLNAALTAGWIVGQSIGQNTTRDFFLFDAAAVATRLLIDPSGRIGVGTTAPNAAALLDLTSTNKGLLLPRMTTAQQDAISSPPDGLLIYNATTAKARVRAGGAWVDLH